MEHLPLKRTHQSGLSFSGRRQPVGQSRRLVPDTWPGHPGSMSADKPWLLSRIAGVMRRTAQLRELRGKCKVPVPVKRQPEPRPQSVLGGVGPSCRPASWQNLHTQIQATSSDTRPLVPAGSLTGRSWGCPGSALFPSQSLTLSWARSPLRTPSPAEG